MDCLNPLEPAAAESPYEVLLRAVLLIPVSHYLLGLSLIVVVFLYNFLEIHILQDLFTGLRGQKVVLTFHPSSQLYRDVVSKCRILHGRYLSTPWLCSPHLQTVFLHFLGNSPVLSYRRQIFITSDGGTLALDWVKNVQVKNLAYQVNDVVEQDDKKPILIIIPGLTSDSNSAYVKHLAFSMAKHGWNVVVSNHRGLGGVSITICDRFINRKLAQRFYNKALTIGLKDYAHLHEDVLSRLSNWEGVKKSRSVRDFDDCATRVLGNYETVDTYYRRSSSSNFVGSVTTPLLCISSLDDPVCTSEAIPWDECRLNTNVVLAVTQHGGHLPFFEGLTAKSVWWVRAVDEFFGILQSSPLSHRKKQTPDPATSPLDPSIDQAPYVHVKEDGMVSAANNQVAEIEVQHQENMDENKSEETLHAEPNVQEKQNTKVELTQPPDVARSPEQDITDIVAPVKRCLNQLSRQNRKSLWLLAYIAILTTWPVVGSALSVFLRKRFQDLLSRVSGKR
ncbi:phospholipase ABHD3-like isoform X2 [Sesamum indicum]|uniref:Phospholipase ABHD3-like isoform X2 n=1 Tax=Sesamum indicum TaxID=4182 RepID=A0A6I9U402_SESIN|nr:phospholipase ABHD3-like isoform X2 [Sesamum indicum]